MAGRGNGASAGAEERTGGPGRRTDKARGNPGQERSAAAGAQRPGDQEAALQSGTNRQSPSPALSGASFHHLLFHLLLGPKQRPGDADRPHRVAGARA